MADETSWPTTLDELRLREDERSIFVKNRLVPLGGRAFDLLRLLLENHGQAVSKNRLIETVWPNVVVEENNLQVQVSALRKVLGPHAIATIPGRGYKLVLAAAAAPVPAKALPNHEVKRGALAAERTSRASGNLPPVVTSLVGRDSDVRAVCALLGEHALVSIVGTGGIGKTCLAQAVAAQLGAEYPDGIWWVELAPLADSALVATTAARVIGAPGSEGGDALQALQTLLADHRALVVLDNCEHVLDAAAAFAEAVAAASPGVHILATSQEPLRAAREQLYRLGTLELPATNSSPPTTLDGAALLFVERARLLDSRFVPDVARWPAVVEICRRLDGIPLAIEMAVARLPLLGLDGVRQRLDQRFNILTGNARTVLRRHQTLRATLDWSHSLLSANEQIVLRRLGVFAGSFDLEAARRVAADEQIDGWAAVDLLGGLVEKSLVIAESGDAPRYRLLETTRAYALERLGDAGETSALLQLHAETLRHLLAERTRSGQAESTGDRAAFASELDNLRAAFAWADGEPDRTPLAVELASFSLQVWQATVSLPEGIEAMLRLAPYVDDRTSQDVQARFWMTLARLGTISARRECYEAAGRAVDLYRQLGDEVSLLTSLAARAAMGSQRNETEAAEAALAEAKRLEHDGLPARLRGSLAWARQRWLTRSDRLEEGLDAVLVQAEHYRRAGLEDWAAIAEGANVASLETSLGRPHSAEARARQALATIERLGMAQEGGHVRLSLATALSDLGRYDEAVAEARAALPLLIGEGDEFRLLEPLALNAALQGRHADAARVLGFADARRAESGTLCMPTVQRLRARAYAIVASKIDAMEVEALKTAGAGLAHSAVYACAFGD